MSTLTRQQGVDTLDVIQATWSPEEIDFLRKLPPAEALVLVELAAYFAARPYPEDML